MIKHIAALLISTAASLAFAADEPDKRTPLERYRGDGQFSLMVCKLNLKMALMQTQLGQAQDENSDWASCIRLGKDTAKTNLPLALKTLKKQKAQEALKSYHVALVTAIDGIAPGTDERRISYDHRQQALEAKVTEAWARFEVEQ